MTEQSVSQIQPVDRTGRRTSEDANSQDVSRLVEGANRGWEIFGSFAGGLVIDFETTSGPTNTTGGTQVNESSSDPRDLSVWQCYLIFVKKKYELEFITYGRDLNAYLFINRLNSDNTVDGPLDVVQNAHGSSFNEERNPGFIDAGNDEHKDDADPNGDLVPLELYVEAEKNVDGDNVTGLMELFQVRAAVTGADEAETLVNQ